MGSVSQRRTSVSQRAGCAASSPAAQHRLSLIGDAQSIEVRVMPVKHAISASSAAILLGAEQVVSAIVAVRASRRNP